MLMHEQKITNVQHCRAGCPERHVVRHARDMPR
jgi:hypothetical protein